MSDKIAILKRAEELVYQTLKDDASGHDWWHIVRVRQLAKEIAQVEKADSFICQLAALLHDMTDDKLVEDTGLARQNLQQWLLDSGVSDEESKIVLTIIDNISFKNGQVPASLEGKIVQDADRLDAIGAIGIARVFAYSGHKGRLIHDPSKKARDQLTVEEYRSGNDTAIMHFYEKLLKLKDLMNTDYGKQLAQQRHAFLEVYLDEFYAEWQGKR